LATNVAPCPKSVQVATFIPVGVEFELLNVMMVRVLRTSGRLRGMRASRPGWGGQLDAEVEDEGAIECEFD
jgi:hypothetical protein